MLARVRSPSELLYSRFTSQKPRFLDQFKEGGYNIASRIATVKRPTTVNQGSGTTITLEVFAIQLAKSAYLWIMMEMKTR